VNLEWSTLFVEEIFFFSFKILYKGLDEVKIFDG